MRATPLFSWLPVSYTCSLGECFTGKGSAPSFPYSSANLYSLKSVEKKKKKKLKTLLSAGCNPSNSSPNQICIWKIWGCTAIFKVWVLGLSCLLYIFKSIVHALFQTPLGALYFNVYFNLCSIMFHFSFGNGFLLAYDLLHNSNGKFLKIREALLQDKKSL